MQLKIQYIQHNQELLIGKLEDYEQVGKCTLLHILRKMSNVTYH